ncbi:MAG: Zn-dependent hydrolase [Chloroflexi bacterium]|nr:MAG: Zn-dependent hydrolase [Chloroflexota bacterium]
MQEPFRVWKDVYAIGGPDLSHPYDCSVYLVVCGSDLALIDCGAGESFHRLVSNIRYLGFKAEDVSIVIATHAHIDHIGALYRFREQCGARVVAHELEAKAIETGKGTGAEMYGVGYTPCQVDTKLSGPEEALQCGNVELRAVHIPGHTPGSIAVYLDIGKRILFGQDIHGPYFLPGSDITDAKLSLQKLIDLRADILCEGHFGIYQPASEVKRYIEGYLYGLYS